MTEPPVHMAIVGGGHMAARHAACIQATPEAQLSAIWSRTREHAAALADPQTRVCGTLEELVQLPDVEAVIVATPTALHAEQALAAVRAGKHVIVEKPLARTMRQAEMLARAAQSCGVLLLTGQVTRFYPAFRVLHDQIAAGEIGAPAVIRMSRETTRPPCGWRSDAEKSGGVILDLGIHEFDWLLWTLGLVTRVYSRGACRSGTGAHDYALTTLRFAGGAIAHVESSMWAARGFRTQGEIAGDRGLITYDSDLDQALRTDLEPQGRAEQDGLPTTYTGSSPYLLQIEHWSRCIRGMEPPEVTVEQACGALRVALAALESAETGKAVTL